MASTNRITAEITLTVKFSAHTSFSDWKIGLTQDLQTKFAQLKSLPSFTYRETDSLRDAQDIESFFLSEQKMQQDVASELVPDQPTFVYVFVAAEADRLS